MELVLLNYILGFLHDFFTFTSFYWWLWSTTIKLKSPSNTANAVLDAFTSFVFWQAQLNNYTIHISFTKAGILLECFQVILSHWFLLTELSASANWSFISFSWTFSFFLLCVSSCASLTVPIHSMHTALFFWIFQMSFFAWQIHECRFILALNSEIHYLTSALVYHVDFLHLWHLWPAGVKDPLILYTLSAHLRVLKEVFFSTVQPLSLQPSVYFLGWGLACLSIRRKADHDVDFSVHLSCLRPVTDISHFFLCCMDS